MAPESGSTPVDVPVGVEESSRTPSWGSDLIMDLLRLLDIEYVAVMPGSTTRGIHDSAVNYTANVRPELILCNHEMITVSMARGYARATGRPMATLLHNAVGLLNAEMTIYDAWCDRTGSVGSLPESLLRGYRIAMTEPQGPVYLDFDVEVQEHKLDEPMPLPDVARYAPASPPAPNADAVREVAERLVAAELPVIFADRLGRSVEAVASLVELAELLSIPVVDMGERCNFPTPHPLEFSDASTSLVRDADFVLGLDAPNLFGAMRGPVDYATREAEVITTAGQGVASISLDEYAHRGWSADYRGLPAVDVPILADTKTALPLLTEECRRLLNGSGRERAQQRRRALDERQGLLATTRRQFVEEQWDHPQITEARLLAELWEVIKDEDFVFTVANPQRMAPGVVHLAGPQQYVAGGSAGGAVGAHPGVALGAGLALRDSGKLPVAILGDGTFFASIQVLWTAAHYGIPSLWVVNNNRSYYNDEYHQDRVATFRGRPPENRWISQRMEKPEVDFAAIARTFGLHGEGPIQSAGDLGPALKRGIETVRQGELVVIDVWTENRRHA